MTTREPAADDVADAAPAPAAPDVDSEPEGYVELMIAYQPRLYAFLFSLLCDGEAAREVLQETNVVLWQKSEQFAAGSNFTAWSFRIARYQVMAWRQRQRRDRHVFDDETLAEVADAALADAESSDGREEALAACLERLPPQGRRLIERRYADGLSVKRIAAELGRTAGAVAVRLHRLRAALLECIDRQGREGGR